MECKKSAAAYIRVSTDDQVEISPDSQLAEIRKYAAREGYLLLEDQIYRDEGISGKKAEKRPGFQRMIAAAKEGSVHFDAILVWKFSRFARNQEESIFYKSILRSKCGVEVVSVTEPLIEGPFGSLIERIIEWMDEFYSLRLSQEVKRSMTLNAHKGVRQIAPPFGYCLNSDGDMVPDAAEAPIIRGIFDDFVSGDGLYHIARKLNDAGLKTHRGNAFENRTIEYIIRNPVYIGKLRWNPSGRSRRDFDHPDIIVSDGKHEPLISQELWENAQRKMAEIKAKWEYKAKPTYNAKFWLQGIIRCANCGATLIWANPHYLKCNNFSRGRCKTSQHTAWNIIADTVIAKMEADLNSDSSINICTAFGSAPEGNRRNMAVKAMEQAKSKLVRLRDAYLNGVIDLEEYAHAKKDLDSSLTKAKAVVDAIDRTKSISAIAADVRADLSRVIDLIKSPDVSVDQKNTAVKSVIKSCMYDKASATIEIIYRALV